MLSKRAKYALNALVELARSQEEGSLSAADLAERAHVPGKFLEAILLQLRHAGIITSTRGRNGGHRLRKDPTEVTMAEVLRLFDGAIGLVGCVTYNYYERCEECVDEATCGVRDVFNEIRTASVELLRKATIAPEEAYETSFVQQLHQQGFFAMVPRGFYTVLRRNPDGTFIERDRHGSIVEYSAPDAGQAAQKLLAGIYAAHIKV